MNMPLKVAILESGKTQVAVAKLAGIAEARLSRIIHEHDLANEDEKAALAKVLRKKVHDLFTEVAA